MALNFTNTSSASASSFSSLASKNTTATAAAGAAAVTTSTSNNVVDTLVKVSVVTPAFTATTSTSVDVYVVGSINGTDWPGAAATAEVITASDAAITLSANSNNLIWLGTIMCHTSGGTFTSEPMPLASRFGGVMPKAWKVVIQNNLPAAVSLTSGTVSYTEVYFN